MPNNKLAAIILCLLLFTGSITTAVLAEATKNGSVMITTANLNVREGPGLSYAVAGKVNKGESYSIVGQVGDWIQISMTNGEKGWIADWFTTSDSVSGVSNATSAVKHGSTGTVTADSLRVRAGPGTDYHSMGSVKSGQKVDIIEGSGSWVKIQFSSLKGWVSKEFIKTEDDTQQTRSQSTGNEAKANDNVNVRTTPTLNGEVIGRLAKGEQVNVTSQTNEWSEVQYQGNVAYVSSQYLTIAGGAQKTETKAELGEVTVTASTLSVRDSGNLNGEVIGQIKHGQKFKILEEADNWLKIEYIHGKTGWAASWYFKKNSSGAVSSATSNKKQKVTILNDGTNIRNGADVTSAVIHRAGKGDTFEVSGLDGEWFEIQLDSGATGYVAGWLVFINGTTSQIERPGAGIHTKNKTVVIDAGHGGRDGGTIGASGTLEKDLTLETAKLLYDKLKASGTNVIMTRKTDAYVSLASRVHTSHDNSADAFISLHYDSISDRSIKGMTTYYYHNSSLSEELHSSVISKTNLKNRGVRFGDYYVIRENWQNNALLELGYLSNPAEEMLVTTGQYQEAVANGLFEGLAKYFKKK